MSQPTSQSSGRAHRAGAFDIRNFIGALIGLYGIALVVYGLAGTGAADLKKSDDVNINLWAGIGMLIVAAVFGAWARLRPVVVPDDPEAVDHQPHAH
jgi:hypothetical protein